MLGCRLHGYRHGDLAGFDPSGLLALRRAGIGFLVVVIRLWGGLAEGVMYAILLMNALVPFINRDQPAASLRYRPTSEGRDDERICRRVDAGRGSCAVRLPWRSRSLRWRLILTLGRRRCDLAGTADRLRLPGDAARHPGPQGRDAALGHPRGAEADPARYETFYVVDGALTSQLPAGRDGARSLRERSSSATTTRGPGGGRSHGGRRAGLPGHHPLDLRLRPRHAQAPGHEGAGEQGDPGPRRQDREGHGIFVASSTAPRLPSKGSSRAKRATTAMQDRHDHRGHHLLGRSSGSSAPPSRSWIARSSKPTRRGSHEETTPNEDLLRGIWRENPVLIQMLGLCPALAVTNTRGQQPRHGARDLLRAVRLEPARLEPAQGDPPRGADLHLHPHHRHLRDRRGHDPRGGGARTSTRPWAPSSP